jgi:hypothetical protein
VSDVEAMKARLKQYEDARAAGIPASTINGCTCDFCTGKKKHEDNWCARCANVRLGPDKHWENLDCCDACEEALSKEVGP